MCIQKQNEEWAGVIAKIQGSPALKSDHTEQNVIEEWHDQCQKV